LHYANTRTGSDERAIELIRSTKESAGPLDHIDSVSVVTMERISSLFQRIRRWGRPEALRLERVLPVILNLYFPPRQVGRCSSFNSS
jgi:hypothetical protein